MYKTDKIGVDVRIDGMLGELSYDINRQRELVESLNEAYEEAHEIALKATKAAIDAATERDEAIKELERLEIIDGDLRRARKDVDQAYDDWLEWRRA